MSIVGRKQCFGLDGGFVNGAIGEVDDFLGMAERKLATTAGVAGVGGRAGITLAKGVRHSFRVDATDKPTSTFHEEFAVPHGSRRQPDFGSISESAAGRRVMETRQ